MVISHIYVSLPEGIINNNGYTWGFLSHRGSSSHNRAIGFWYQVMVVGLWATTKWNVMVKNMFYYSDCHFNSSFEPIERLFNHNFPIFCSSSQIINLYIYIYTYNPSHFSVVVTSILLAIYPSLTLGAALWRGTSVTALGEYPLGLRASEASRGGKAGWISLFSQWKIHHDWGKSIGSSLGEQ